MRVNARRRIVLNLYDRLLPLLKISFLSSLTWILTGCHRSVEPLYPLNTESPTALELGSAFSESNCGSIYGTVLWDGPRPEPMPLWKSAPLDQLGSVCWDPRINNWLPRIRNQTSGLEDAVVFLKNVDPARSCKIQWPQVEITVGDEGIVVAQGAYQGHTGFVFPGSTVQVKSMAERYSMLRFRGSAFFTLALPQRGVVLERTLPNEGIIELKNAASNYWERGWIFVTSHPYYTRTDANGNFKIDDIPDGEYELVCQHPHWQIEHFERDPEMFQISNVTFREPLRTMVTVRVEKGMRHRVEILLGQNPTKKAIASR